MHCCLHTCISETVHNSFLLHQKDLIVIIFMASNFSNLSPSDAHPETMDLLSRAWCNFAVQALQPEPHDGLSLVLADNPMKQLKTSPMASPKVSQIVSINHFNTHTHTKSSIVSSIF